MRAAFTITPRSRLQQARALARSYLDHHPDHAFDIVLVSERWPEGDEDAWREGPGTVVDFRAITVPDPPNFHARHEVDDLCVALRPFAIRHLLQARPLEGLVYLDPDVLVLSPLDAAWGLLGTHDIVLAPRMRRPLPWDAMRDREHADATLYSSGFVGIRPGSTAGEVLSWWCTREFNDPLAEARRVSPAVDAIPVYFARVGILSDPASNVARYNLHERTLAVDGTRFHVDGKPVAWFHFATHNRHDPGRVMPGQWYGPADSLRAYEAISSVYARAVRRESTGAADAGDHLRLSNGVPLGRVLNRVVMQGMRRRLAFPSPAEADAFCGFATRPGPALTGDWVAPVVTAILALRPDVVRAFPGARHDKDDPAFHRWLVDHGAQEESLQALLVRWGGNLRRVDGVTAALDFHEASAAARDAFPDVLADDSQHVAYAEWLGMSGARDSFVGADAITEYAAAAGGVQRVLDCYFCDPALMAALPLLHDDETTKSLTSRLSDTLPAFPRLAENDLVLFRRSSPVRRLEILLACLRYNPHARAIIGGAPSVFRAERIEAGLERHGVEAPLRQAVARALQDGWISPAAQYLAFVATDEETRRIYPVRDPDVLAMERMHYVLDRHGPAGDVPGWPQRARELLQWQRAPRTQEGANLFGPLLDATGMGESARALKRVIQRAGIPLQCNILPGRFPGAPNMRPPARMYGTLDEQLPVNLIVANADASEHMRFWIPKDARLEHLNVGCWVWETETLPSHWKDAARDLDAIIAPSRYAADAISRTVEVPVHALPHALDLAQLDAAVPDRARFGLPEEALVFGFFFDTKSVLERKNPAAVIEAFRRAFGSRDDVCLLLKVNTPVPGDYDFERLAMQARGLNVRWLGATLSTADTHALMASLDAYVSLHRSEGFGLTLAEAMAMGKPVIATGYSGNMDFMDAACALPVEYVVETTARDYGPYPAGSRWANPSIDHCARLMSSLQAADERARIGALARGHVSALLDPANLAPRLRGILAALRAQPEAPATGQATAAPGTVE